MKQTIEYVDGIGKVLVQQSEEGEPLFVGFVKLGDRSSYHSWVSVVGALVIVVIALKYVFHVI
jgi:hypothetical protein